MEQIILTQEKVTVTGPKDEIDYLKTYLQNREINIQVIRSSPHFPFWKSFKDLYLVVHSEKLQEAVTEICSRTRLSRIYKGWIDFSGTFYPICADTQSKSALAPPLKT